MWLTNSELPAPTNVRFHRLPLVITKHLAWSSAVEEDLAGGPEDNLQLQSDQGPAVIILMEALLISRKLKIGVWQDSHGAVLHYSLPRRRWEEGELFKLNTWGGRGRGRDDSLAQSQG